MFGRKISIQTALILIIISVFLPILGVIGMAILNAAASYREASTQQLLETAQVVSQAVDSELDATARLMHGVAELRRLEIAQNQTAGDGAALLGGSFALVTVQEGQAVAAGPGEIGTIALEAARSGQPSLSNIIAQGLDGDEGPHLVLAVPHSSGEGREEIAVLVASPAELIRSLARTAHTSGNAILAITDGSGRIIGRSVDGERFVGRPVPDWETLRALDTDRGWFRATTIEGNQIVFAFSAIPGTPGWMAVVGEPAASFDARWQGPIMTMVIASAITVLLAIVMAILLARQVLRPISGLVKRAQAIVADDSANPGRPDIAVPPSFVSEFETLRTSLDHADAVLHRSLDESRAAEHAALQSAQAMREAERLARIGSWTLDLATHEFVCSDMLYELNGADPDGPPLTVADLQGFMTRDSLRDMQRAMDRCIATGEPYGIEVEHLRKDGRHFQAFIQGQRICDEHGKAIKLSGTVQDVSERNEERKRLAALADNLPSGVIFRLEGGSGTAMHASYVSAGIEDLVGLSPAEIVDDLARFVALVDPEGQPGLDTLFDSSLQPGQVFDHAVRVNTGPRGTIWMHIRAALRLQANGSFVWDGIARDITSEREVADALRAAKDAAEAAESAKSDFLATMSHEIRTPMNTVIGMTRLALQTDLDARQRNYLEKINGSATALLGIINDILDFSKIEAGGMTLEGAVFSLESVLEGVSAVTALRAEEKGLELAFAVDPSIPSHLQGDALRLGQVLTNLVSNAVKFTDQGEIVVSVRPAGIMTGDAIRLEFSVKDTGIGLTEHEMAGLFRPFTQAASDTSRRYGGTGLGLAICRRLVEMMDGEIGVQSEPGLGSTFSFNARFERVRDAEIPAVAIKTSGQIRGRRALIVDDNQSAREALAEMVGGFGMSVETVASGKKAIALLREQAALGTPFDIVLLDWRMPEQDGLETARLIRADQGLPDMPAVLMVTAFGHEVVMQAVDEIGLQGVLLKPVTQSLMFNTILGALAPAKGTLEDGAARSRTPANSGSDLAALAGRRVLVVDDNALNREVATDFLELVGVKVETAVNGADALAKIAAQRFDVVLMDMHMPVMNGLDAVREIRKRPEWANLPVVALTAQARVEDHRASIEAGMTAHLTKPIDEKALYGTLMEVLGLSGADGAGHEAAPDNSNEEVDLVAIRSRFGGDDKRTERVMRGFLRDFSAAPTQLESLLATQDWEGLAELVHQIKGGAGYVASAGLVDSAEALERAARRHDMASVLPLAAPFIANLRKSLAALENALAAVATPTATPGTAFDSLAALDLVERALPLVQKGEFAANALLEQLSRTLSANALQADSVHIQDLFDELEIEAAVSALRALRAQLAESAPEREAAR